MAKFELSAHEITRLAKKAIEIGTPSGLPTSKPGFYSRAEKENWEFQEVMGQGGRGGIKKLYTLPKYVVDELREKNLLGLIEESGLPENEEADAAAPAGHDTAASAIQDLIAAYPDWAARQDAASIVPVRYHAGIFASAGPGTIPWDEDAEAMWFRASFFKHLGIKPDCCFCTRIKGDSMFPTLLDRGTALWQATGRYTEEGIYLFRQAEELRVKRLQRISATVFRIISDNDNKSIYPTLELDLATIGHHEFEIYGRYLWSCGIAN